MPVDHLFSKWRTMSHTIWGDFNLDAETPVTRLASKVLLYGKHRSPFDSCEWNFGKDKIYLHLRSKSIPELKLQIISAFGDTDTKKLTDTWLQLTYRWNNGRQLPGTFVRKTSTALYYDICSLRSFIKKCTRKNSFVFIQLFS